ncbi:MAG: hypothetical protein WKG00_16670 [Polyangiaceae bacterium]
MRAVASLALLALALVAGCGAERLPVPPSGPHAGDGTLVVVPFPPPAARAEIISAPPKEMTSPVWVDGEWQWKGRRWVWQRGQWENLQPGAYYAPSTVITLADGSIGWYGGRWYAGAAPAK